MDPIPAGRVMQCKQCGQSFKHISSLQSHEVLHASGKLFKCRFCRTYHSNHSSLMKHILTEHPKNVTDSGSLKKKKKNHNQTFPPGKYVCKLCKRSYTNKGGIRMHVTWHKSRGNFKFEGIGEEFLSWNEFFASHPPGAKPYTKIYECEKCLKEFAVFSEFASHWLEENPYTCLLCGKKFTSASFLSVHIQKHITITPFTCRRCYKHFKDHRSLLIHNDTHLGERPYCCGICTGRFPTAESIQKHMEAHMETHIDDIRDEIVAKAEEENTFLDYEPSVDIKPVPRELTVSKNVSTEFKAFKTTEGKLSLEFILKHNKSSSDIKTEC